MKIVLTGGPSAGKTTITELLARAYWNRLTIVTEAASLLFRGGFPRGDHDENKQRSQQRAIYFVQRELEEIGRLNSNGRALVCDRGTLDGLAYWPGSESEFFEAIESSINEQIARYEWVFHMDTASASYYKNSAVRIENQETADKLNEKVKHVWSKHPNRLIIPRTDDFLNKLAVTTKAVEMILNQSKASEVQSYINSSIAIP